MSNTNNWEKKSILIADDDNLNFELLKLMLRNTNINIEHFSNGQSVVDFLADHDTDIIIMDIQMPILDGNQTTIKLRESGFDKPIIALTALNTASEQNTYIKTGFNQVVEKPIRKDVFIKLLEKYLN